MGINMWNRIWDWLNEDISKFIWDFFKLENVKEDK
jgi:hypothetical protein